MKYLAVMVLLVFLALPALAVSKRPPFSEPVDDDYINELIEEAKKKKPKKTIPYYVDCSSIDDEQEKYDCYDAGEREEDPADDY